MTRKEKIIQYVLHTPCNTNRQILESLLIDLSTGTFDFSQLIDQGQWENKEYPQYSVVYDEHGNIYIALVDVSKNTSLDNPTYWVKILGDVELHYDYVYGGTASGIN